MKAEQDLALQQSGEQVEGSQNAVNRNWEQEQLFPQTENNPLVQLRGQTDTTANN